MPAENGAPLQAMLTPGAETVFYVLLLIFVFHTIVLGYHWFTYGEKKQVGKIALAIYLIGGAIFFIVLAVLLKHLHG